VSEHAEKIREALQDARETCRANEQGASGCPCDELDRALTELDALVAENERLRALLKDTNESLIEACASETRLQADRRALAERVREACATLFEREMEEGYADMTYSEWCEWMTARLRALDLEPLLTPESKP
jgi:hypothetical protein